MVRIRLGSLSLIRLVNILDFSFLGDAGGLSGFLVRAPPVLLDSSDSALGKNLPLDYALDPDGCADSGTDSALGKNLALEALS